VGAAALLLWTGWYEGRSVPHACEEQPATKEQQILTAAAVDRLRAVFSSGACQSIYDEAGQHFHSQTEVDWLYECDRLRENLGAWQGFDIQSTTTYGTPRQFVLVEGLAVFAKASRRFAVTWLMDGGGPQLDSLSLQDHGK